MKKPFYQTETIAIKTMIQQVLGPSPHFHKEVEIIYVVNGDSKAWVDRKFYHLKDGDLLIVFPHQMHYYREPVQGLYYAILVNPNIFFDLTKTLNEYIPINNLISLPKDSEIPEILEKTVMAKGEYRKTLKAGYLNQIMAHTMPSLELKERIQTTHATLERILDYCTNNFTNTLSLDSISSDLHLNKYHVSHLFNEKLSITFNTYLNMLRINKAAELLETDDTKNMASISEEAGFGSIRSFNRAFYNAMNMTPSDYRKMLQKYDR